MQLSSSIVDCIACGRYYLKVPWIFVLLTQRGNSASVYSPFEDWTTPRVCGPLVYAYKESRGQSLPGRIMQFIALDSVWSMHVLFSHKICSPCNFGIRIFV